MIKGKGNYFNFLSQVSLGVLFVLIAHLVVFSSKSVRLVVHIISDVLGYFQV